GQSPSPVASSGSTSHQELASRDCLGQIDHLSAQASSTGTTRVDGSPTCTDTIPLGAWTSAADTFATHRPSNPAPAPSANSARAARIRPGVGCAHASERSELDDLDITV